LPLTDKNLLLTVRRRQPPANTTLRSRKAPPEIPDLPRTPYSGQDNMRDWDRMSNLSSRGNRLLKKAHLLRCTRSPRSNVSTNTPPLVDFSRASHLRPFWTAGIMVFQYSGKDWHYALG